MKTRAAGGADYTFDCTGNVEVMRQALERINEAFDLMHSGQSIRGVVVY